MRKCLLLLSLCFIGIFAYPQVDPNCQWAWIKGDNTVNATGVYGTKGIPADTTKPGAREGSVSWIDLSGNFWLYGGRNGSGIFNDLWKYDPTTNQWTWINGSNTTGSAAVYGTQGVEAPANQPGNRLYGVSWTDISGNLWLFGGSSVSGYLNDLWKYNPGTNAWTWMKGDNTSNVGGNYGTQGTASTTNKPGARFSSSAWADATGNLWLFGGRGYVATGAPNLTSMNDLWRYNPSTNQWTWVKGDNTGSVASVYGTQGVPSSANKPGARYGSASWIDASGNLWLFGGESVTSLSVVFSSYNDLWRYDPSNNQWTWINGDNTVNNNSVYGTQGVPDPANKPGGRFGSSFWSDSYGNLWLFGGQMLYGAFASTQNNYNDLWKLTISTNQWTWVKGDNTANNYGDYGTLTVAAPANKPGSRLSAVSWTDVAGNFWMFGGSGKASAGTGNLNDLWKLANNNSILNLCNNGSITINCGFAGSNYQWQVDDSTGFSNITNNSNYSGAGTFALQLSNIPSSWYGYKYRCVVDGLNTTIFQIKFSNQWTGSNSNVWEDPSNWSCNIVPDANTDVIINSGTIVLTSSTTIRSLKLNPGANLTVVAPAVLTILH